MPTIKGTLSLTMIWRFIVRHVRTMKYMTRIGQNTGTSNTSKKVQKKAKVVDFIVESLSRGASNVRMFFWLLPELELW